MSDQIDKLTGLVERITFHNPENGYSVIKISVSGTRDLITVIGNIAALSVGEHIESDGVWIQNKQYGKQFKADTIRTVAPNSIEGIEKYLSSGLIKGIGPVYARKLMNAFGADIFNVIENEPYRLKNVEGIGKARIDQIIQSWSEQKVIRQIMLFLHGYDIPTSRAIKIFKFYGQDAIKIIQENPYKLAQDVAGIGFKSADKIAEKMGIEKDSAMRIRSGISYCLEKALDQSQCSVPIDQMLKMCLELLEIPEEPIMAAIKLSLERGEIVCEEIDGLSCIFLRNLHIAERFIAEKLIRIRDAKLPWPNIDPVDSIKYIEEALTINLSATQKLAIEEALKTKLLVITGGPGVGKTTIVNSILKILQAENVKVNLAAPTGRAAKRMFDATGCEAKTLHRLLQKNIGQNDYRSNVLTLECDLLIVDEVSMVDVPLMFSLLSSLPDHTALFLVGDIDQLPSVGPGTVLHDLITSQSIPVIRLTEIFRQAQESKIITNAYKVNQGIMPVLANEGENSDFFFIEAETPEDTLSKIVALVSKRIPAKFGISPIKDIQILCPMNKGLIGTKNLNLEIQKVLNVNQEKSINVLGTNFRVGDKVMQIENNYDKEIYNGDIGIINSINEDEKEMLITFDNKKLIYEFADLDELNLAYAVTIHKSQGSEYHTIIVPVLMEHFIMLQRNLLYTSITRGKKLVILVGQKRAIETAVGQKNDVNRYSSLKKRIVELNKNYYDI